MMDLQRQMKPSNNNPFMQSVYSKPRTKKVQTYMSHTAYTFIYIQYIHMPTRVVL